MGGFSHHGTILIFLTVMVSTAFAYRCVGSAVSVHAADMAVEYRNNTNCYIFVTSSKTDKCVLALFSNFNSTHSVSDYFNMIVFSANDTQGGAQLDSIGQTWLNTAISSNGPVMKIQLPLQFNRRLNISAHEFNCTIHLHGESGKEQLPVYFNRYPKNLYMRYQITPFFGSTTTILFSDIDIKEGNGNETSLVLINGQIEPIVGRSTEKNVSRILTEEYITIVISSDPLNNVRGRGFQLQYKVCVENVIDSTGTFSLPANSMFLNRSKYLRCSTTFSQGPDNVTVLSVIRFKKQTDSDTLILELFNGSDNSSYLSKLDNLQENDTETYIGSTSTMTIVYSHKSSTVINYPVIQGHYTSREKECSHLHAGTNTSFAPQLYDRKYANNFNCVYTVNTNSSQHVFLNIRDISLADSGDIIMINESGKSTIIQNGTTGTTYSADSNEVKLQFSTNGFSTSTGFVADVSACGATNDSSYGEIREHALPSMESTNETYHCSYILGNDTSISESIVLIIEANEFEEDCLLIEGDDNSRRVCLNKTQRVLHLKKSVAKVMFQPTKNQKFVIMWNNCGQLSQEANGIQTSNELRRRQDSQRECSFIVDTGPADAIVFLQHGNETDCFFKIGESLSKDMVCLNNSLTVYSTVALLQLNNSIEKNVTVTWTSTPFVVMKTSGNYSITSLGYPNNLPLNTRIVYKIKPMDDSSLVSLKFVDSYLGNNADGCTGEFVQLEFINASTSQQENFTICTFDEGTTYNSRGPVNITLQTSNRMYRGFNLTYEVHASKSKGTSKDENGVSPQNSSASLIIGIIGGIAGLLLVVGLIILGITACKRRSNPKKHDGAKENPAFEKDPVSSTKKGQPIPVKGNDDAGCRNEVNSGDPIYVGTGDGVYDKLNIPRAKLGGDIVPDEVTYSDGMRRVSRTGNIDQATYYNNASYKSHTGTTPSGIGKHDNGGIERNDKLYTMVQKTFKDDSTKEEEKTLNREFSKM